MSVVERRPAGVSSGGASGAVEPAGRRAAAVGTLLAIGSAATFGLSGPTAKSLLEAGWSPLTVTLLRIGGGAVVLLVPTLVLLARSGGPRVAGWRTTVLYGVTSIAGVQLGFYNAVQTLTVGVAMLVEYLAPVLLLGWTWWRTGRRPGSTCLVGAGTALVGLVLVIDLTGGVAVDPVGLAWAFFAACCLASYFALSAHAGDRVHPVVMAGAGSAVGAVTLAVVGALGVLPLHVGSQRVRFAGLETSWLVPAAVVVLVATVAAYLTGIAAVQRLGSRVASFVGLTEALFAVVF
ncbi:MAG TPA: EamA family transporter, partial [Segeticoccus sp.]|nr:EamA family transporter [Segeticoccus sp.]